MDVLFWASVDVNLKHIFVRYRGTIDKQGGATAALKLPVIVGLIGQKIHTGFATFSATATSGVKTLSKTVTFTVTK